MQNMQAICRFDDFVVYCPQYTKYAKKICTICKICQTQYQYAEYALPTLLMHRRPRARGAAQ